MPAAQGTEHRLNEINFLQEQNRTILDALEKAETECTDANDVIRSCEEKDAHLQAELQSVRDKINALGARISQDKSETSAKDEHVRVLKTQNQQMLTLLEAEEAKSKQRLEQIVDLTNKNRKLQRISEEFDTAKAEIEAQVAEAKSKGSETMASLKGQRSLNDTLRANIQNTEAKTRVDIEALGQALQVVDQKNLEYLQRINKQESKETQLKAETETLKEEVEKVRMDIDELRKTLEGDQEGRTNFERARSQMEMSIEALEVQADTLKKALSTAERANEQLQEENHTSAERSRETADKVYALMDSLRLNQVELKKQEAENQARDKKIITLERMTHNLQAKIAMETDAKILAEQERKEAEQEAGVLKKKNKKVEEAVTTSQQAQEKAEREISDMNERVGEMQTQNAFLASRIDGQEEEKSALKSEVKVVADRTAELSSDNSKLRDQIDQLEEQVATMGADKDQMKRELEYIKREDVLDDAGRQRPILIQSTDSELLEKLQINEFLYEAQQARNPVPPLIDKVAQLLAMLHDGQTRADQYLGDLSKSNGLVTGLRQRNMALFNRSQMFESFKTRALLRYVMNLAEGNLISDLHLDGLSFGPREINEMMSLFGRYECYDQVHVLSLQNNALDEDNINLLMQVVFQLPYLRSLDLKRNCIPPEAVKRMEEELKQVEGVTGVIRTAAQVINVHSGNQLRLSIDVSEQLPKDKIAKEVDFTVVKDLAHDAADPFLSTQAGESHHPWTKTSAATKQASPMTAIPDPSSTELPKPSAGPAAPVIGGPPVGLGGPGNVAALSKKSLVKGKDRLPDPSKRRQSRRAKGAPPPPLDEPPSRRDREMSPLASTARPSSANRREAQLSSARAHAAAVSAAVHAAYPDGTMGARSCSMPALSRPPQAPRASSSYRR